MSSKPNEESEKTQTEEKEELVPMLDKEQPQTPPEPEKKRKTSIFRDPYVKVE